MSTGARDASHDPERALTVGIVAGESSGDTLGAALIAALRALVPQLKCYGVAGPKMQAAGCEAWAAADELALMGFTEPLLHLPRLLKLRSMLISRFAALRPDVFVGVDAPAFNLGLERRLRQQGIRTVQYVSPQVWAWRQSRVRSIAASCDLVLCLLPFETEFYAQHGVRAVFVGHPLADQIPLEIDTLAAREQLRTDPHGKLIALLPGSRLGEVERLGSDFAAAAQWIAERTPKVSFVAPMATPRVRAVFERQLAQLRLTAPITLLNGQAQLALAAADGVIVASGTATLETLLTGRPMVVAYRLSAATAFLLRALGLIKVPYFSQPNLLVGRPLVPEFFQEQVTGAALGSALLRELGDADHRIELAQEFRRVHQNLRRGGAALAAASILELTGRRDSRGAAS